MRKLKYKNGKIYEKDRPIYKLKKSGRNYEVLFNSGKLVSRFKIKKVFSLKDIREAIIGNIRIRKEKNAPIEDSKILNRNFIKLYPNSGIISLLKEEELLGNFDFLSDEIESIEDEGLLVTIFFALKEIS